jgi:hypothetical protein
VSGKTVTKETAPRWLKSSRCVIGKGAIVDGADCWDRARIAAPTLTCSPETMFSLEWRDWLRPRLMT